MPRKTLKVQVELDVQAVTCPGVWLCPSGKISLQLCMLDSCIQTTGLLPNFPLLYHEKYIFYKLFDDARSLSDLQRSLNKEQLYAELIQWQNCDIGNVIASFQTSLGDVLYPSAYEGAIAGVDVDLLMEPSKHFPGIISPKIEISTRTTVEETVCTENNDKQSKSFVINPKTLTSEQRSCPTSKRSQVHQQKVCHSLGYHKTRNCIKTKRMCNKPPFVFRKAEEDLISRKPSADQQNSIQCCKCCSQPLTKSNRSPPASQSRFSEDLLCSFPKSRGKPSIASKAKGKGPKRRQMCACGSGHTENYCTVCSKYNYYFDGDTCSGSKSEKLNRFPPRSYVRKISDRGDGISELSLTNNLLKNACGCIAGSPSTSSPRCAPCGSNNVVNKNSCVCMMQKKPSLAQQLHTRLKQTLDCASYENSECEAIRNTCSKFSSYKHGFNDNLKKFYKDLHE